MCGMEIKGVPLHPLVIHAVVVLVPLAALAAIAMSVPKYRWIARWPALLLTLGATAAAYVATLTGEDLAKDRGLDALPLVKTHEEWGERLMIAMWIFAVLVIVAFWVLPHVTRISGAQGPRRQGGGAGEAADGARPARRRGRARAGVPHR